MSVIKCPNCKAELSTSITICEWCNFVLNREGNDSLESITEKLSELISSSRKIPQQNVFSSLTKNAKISMPIFAIVCFVLAYKINFLFSIAGILFGVYAIVSFFKKPDNSSSLLFNTKADFEAEFNRLNTLYGGNNAVAKQIQSIKNEWKSVLQEHQRSKKMEWISYIMIISLLSISFLLPQSKTAAEVRAEKLQVEESIVLEAIELIQSNNFDGARQKLTLISTQQNNTRILSMIQLKQCENILDSAKLYIDAKKFGEAQSVLKKTKWTKISTDYDAELVEESFYNQFVQQKNEIISILPESYSVNKENEFNF
jgi:hypothetical protein